MSERFHSIQVRAEDAAEVALAIARRFRALGWKVVRDPKGRGAPAASGDPDGLRRFLISSSDRGWVTILPSGAPDVGPDSLVAFLARECETLAIWLERLRRSPGEPAPVGGDGDERLGYEVYWKGKRIDRQDAPEIEAGKVPSSYPTLIDQDLQSLQHFMPSGQKHPKLTVADLPRFYPKYAGDKAYYGRFKKLVTTADYPMLWGTYQMVWNPAAPELERLESWGHLGFQKEDGRSAAARLTHGDPAARRGAVEALASCSADEARPGLQAALADDDAEVRLAAALVVAARPDKGLAQDLSDRLADDDVRVRTAAARALKDMGIDTTAESLAEIATEEEVEVRRAAIAALAAIESPIARAALLAAAKKDKDAEVRRWAAEGLGRAPLSEVAAELGRLLTDKSEEVRSAAARAVVAARGRELGARGEAPSSAKRATDGKVPGKLVEALRKVANETGVAQVDGVRALRALLPEDKEGRELAMKLAANDAKAGELTDLAVRLPRGEAFAMQDKRIVTSLLKRLEKEPTADVIAALGNQNDDRVPEALKSLLPRLWVKAADDAAAPSRIVLQSLADARTAIVYALARLDVSAFSTLLRVLELERARKVPADPSQLSADETGRLAVCFGAMEAILQLVPDLKQEALDRLNERLQSWVNTAEVDAGAIALRRAALLAYGQAVRPVVVEALPAVVPVILKPAGKAAAAPAKPVPHPVPAAALPNKDVIALVKPLLNDPKWPEVPLVLARQLGAKAANGLQAALERSIDKEVRLAKKGGYSRRDSETVSAHRRGLVSALRELKDATAVNTLVRLLTLESLRAGKVERRAETSLLGVTINALQTITGYKFGAEPQRWAEVAAGKLPPPAEFAKRAAVAASKSAASAAKTAAAAALAKKALGKSGSNVISAAKKLAAEAAKPPVIQPYQKPSGPPPRKIHARMPLPKISKAAARRAAEGPAKKSVASKVATKKPIAKAKAKPGAKPKTGFVKSLVRGVMRVAGARKVASPRNRMAAKSARAR